MEKFRRRWNTIIPEPYSPHERVKRTLRVTALASTSREPETRGACLCFHSSQFPPLVAVFGIYALGERCPSQPRAARSAGMFIFLDSAVEIGTARG